MPDPTPKLTAKRMRQKETAALSYALEQRDSRIRCKAFEEAAEMPFAGSSIEDYRAAIRALAKEQADDK